MAEWRDEKYKKYRDRPELIPTKKFEERIKKTQVAIQRVQELVKNATVENIDDLKGKLKMLTSTRKTCELGLQLREKEMAKKESIKQVQIRKAKMDGIFKPLPTEEKDEDVKQKSASKLKATVSEPRTNSPEKQSSREVQSPTKNKSSSSEAESTSSSSPVFRTRTPTSTPNLALADDLVDLEKVHTQEEIDFGSDEFSTQTNKALEIPMELDDIDMAAFDNLTQEDEKESDLEDVAKSPSRNVTRTPTPELAATQELVEKQSSDIAIKTTWKGKKGVADRVRMYLGDITKLDVDAIVNAANEKLLGGLGIDGAIHKAAGPKLLDKCRRLKGCKTGEAKITPGYNLPAKTIIHAVGPRDENKEKLKSAYESSMQLMIVHNLKTIAFPCISTGIYGYPPEKAASVAIKTVKDFMERNPNHIDGVTFCLYSQKDVDIYKNEMKNIFPGENITFVDEKNTKDSAVPVKDQKDKKRDRSPSTESDDAYVKLSRKKELLRKRVNQK